MGLFTMLRFLTPNGTVTVSEAGTDLTTTAALGQAVENLDTYAARINGTNTLTSAATIDASLASDTLGLKLPSKAGAAPTAAGQVAFDSTAGGLAFGDGTNTVGLTGMKRLGDTTLGGTATNITFSAIPGTYKHLLLEIQSRGDGATTVEGIGMQFNADTGSNYDTEDVFGANVTPSATSTLAGSAARIGVQPAASAARAAIAGTTIVDIPNYAGTTFEKSAIGRSTSVDSTAANNQTFLRGSSWRSTAAITSIKLFPLTSTNFVAGSRATLYGIS